jgi:hypothetical protein
MRVEDGVLGLMARIVKRFFGHRRSGVQISACDCMHKRLAVYARIYGSPHRIYLLTPFAAAAVALALAFGMRNKKKEKKENQRITSVRHRYRVDLSLALPAATDFKCGFVALLLHVGKKITTSWRKILLRRKSFSVESYQTYTYMLQDFDLFTVRLSVDDRLKTLQVVKIEFIVNLNSKNNIDTVGIHKYLGPVR